jgi:hypothetical protein
MDMTGGWYTGGVYGMLNRGAGVADYSFTKGGTKEAAIGGTSGWSKCSEWTGASSGASYGTFIWLPLFSQQKAVHGTSGHQAILDSFIHACIRSDLDSGVVGIILRNGLP